MRKALFGANWKVPQLPDTEASSVPLPVELFIAITNNVQF